MTVRYDTVVLTELKRRDYYYGFFFFLNIPESPPSGFCAPVAPGVPVPLSACCNIPPAMPFTSGINLGSEVVPVIVNGIPPPLEPSPAICVTPPAAPPLRLAFILKLSALLGLT